MAEKILQIKNLRVQLGGQTALNQINLTILDDQQWALVGPSGSGKTVLAHTLCGRHFYAGEIEYNFPQTNSDHPDILVVDQQHRFRNLSNTNDFYYQQRYNSQDSGDAHTVAEELAPFFENADEMVAGIPAKEIPTLLHIEHLFDEPLIQLSNGENKRLQLAKAILRNPQLLILDNPFIGLDVSGRKILAGVIDQLTRKTVKILLICSPKEIPASITHIAQMESGKIISEITKTEWDQKNINSPINPHRLNHDLLQKIKIADSYNFKCAVRMVNVHVQYGDKKVLQGVNWEVKKGERWSLSGPNGAGKSTLLSLVTGDNPQAYANEIYLFDRRRGTGESIWDIKKRIGYISPEMHLYFDQNSTCFETIASGLFDSIGLFRTLSQSQSESVSQWIDLMQLGMSRNKPLRQLSAGQQRLILLARAFVKNPELLILDEPCQGMDEEQKDQFIAMVDEICRQFHSTLIYVSHYRDEIPPCIDQFLELEDGMKV